MHAFQKSPDRDGFSPPSLAAHLMFDRSNGELAGATARDRLVVGALQAGARTSSAWYYRGFAAGCKALRNLTPEQTIAVRLNEDAVFSFPFCDGYWSLLLDRNYSYERDMEAFFRGIADADYTLIDCGANFGYWSTLVSSRPFGGHASIAIEPSSANFAILSQNAAINRDRFSLVRSTVGATPGTARLSGEKHEALTISGTGGEQGEVVPVITLDNLISRHALDTAGRFVIKLDVEGVEIDAMKGGARLLQTDCVVICEEHGNDRNHTISRYILENTALRLFCYDPATRRFERLADVSSLDRIKKAANFGYNVLSTASSYWEDRIRSMRPDPSIVP